MWRAATAWSMWWFHQTHEGATPVFALDPTQAEV
ncbi:hypothetical protein BVRB_3g051070 [Beta vulgaris subsp. vulgaris]|uniref:Uncharacterized protein n=1 Tax=Beta vulgaris subsp. vulgaris TaxID=3555 RepID=A0A0J8CRT9_BETVV|nr:hypothetical protein BVRB_3g051070 [Beta vulgaris subsp. vulgaris]